MPKAPGWPARPSVGPVELRPPQLRDARTWSEIRLRNERWLQPWEPTAAASWAERNSVGAWASLNSALHTSGRRGTMLPFMIVYGGRLVGQLNVSNVVHGALRSCTVGYWVDGAVAGRGITPAALAVAIDHCFGAVGLHRVEVDIRPENAPEPARRCEARPTPRGLLPALPRHRRRMARPRRLRGHRRGARWPQHGVPAARRAAATDVARAPLTGRRASRSQPQVEVLARHAVARTRSRQFAH